MTVAEFGDGGDTSGEVSETVKQREELEQRVRELLHFDDYRLKITGQRSMYVSVVPLKPDMSLNRSSLRAPLHISFLESSLASPVARTPHYCNQPWVVYWVVHAMDLLGTSPSPEMRSHLIATLDACRVPSEGGFSGYPGGTVSHLATTYAAVMSVAIFATEDAYALIDRKALRTWIARMKRDDGSYAMHLDGESDLRATYCAVAVASLLGLLDGEMVCGVADCVRSCQTYEGGLGAIPGAEAHAAHTFCGLAALVLTQAPGAAYAIDLMRLIDYAAHRQSQIEGGFSGRTNKLVDACYSYWAGATFAILRAILEGGPKVLPSRSDGVAATTPTDFGLNGPIWIPEPPTALAARRPPPAEVFGTDTAVRGLWYAQGRLESYLLACCQDEGQGGLFDKPGTVVDNYHTCYALSGLALGRRTSETLPKSTHPIYNVRPDKALGLYRRALRDG